MLPSNQGPRAGLAFEKRNLLPAGLDLTRALSKRKYQTSMRCFRRLQTYEFRLGHLRRRRF
jgi:hypothetical protein